MGDEVLLLCFNFTMTIAMKSHLLDDVRSVLREYPIAIGEDVGWIHFLSRDAHKCSERCLNSTKEGILSIALWEFHCTLGIVSHNSNSSTLPMSRIIFLDFSMDGL